jgi:hypothetical protein
MSAQRCHCSSAATFSERSARAHGCGRIRHERQVRAWAAIAFARAGATERDLGDVCPRKPQFLVEPTHRLHERISNSRVTVMSGQQHVAMNTAPDLFLKHVLDFLD